MFGYTTLRLADQRPSQESYDRMSARYPYVHITVLAAEAELASLELWELGATGIEERDASTMNAPDAGAGLTLSASFGSEDEARAAVRQLCDRWPADVVFVEGDAWREAYKAYFKPTRMGAHLVVKPSWEAFEQRPGDIVLTLDPGGAFGTGTHESTRLVLEMLEAQVRPGMRVLDVGCGSGILAIACLLLGADSACAIDLDPEAVRVSRENALANGVQVRLQVSEGPLGALEGRYPLVLANIESRVLVPLAAELGARVAPGGVLILSGLLLLERAALLSAYAPFAPLHVREQGDWLALVLQRRDGR
jgi:ribosomal protein L11 methyltransferase